MTCNKRRAEREYWAGQVWLYDGTNDRLLVYDLQPWHTIAVQCFATSLCLVYRRLRLPFDSEQDLLSIQSRYPGKQAQFQTLALISGCKERGRFRPHTETHHRVRYVYKGQHVLQTLWEPMSQKLQKAMYSMLPHPSRHRILLG